MGKGRKAGKGGEEMEREEMEVKGKGRDDRPDDLGDLEMTWLA